MINNKDKNCRIIIFFYLFCTNTASSQIFVSNKPWGYFGDNFMSFAIAKAMSMQYGIKFYYSKFPHSDLFLFDQLEDKLPPELKIEEIVGLSGNFGYEKQISDLDKITGNRLMYTYCLTPCGMHANQEVIDEIRRLAQPKIKPQVDIIPKNSLSIAIHIRKGNGGGEHYDGELVSQQLFDFDRSVVMYHSLKTHAFENLEEYYACDQSSKWSMDAGYSLLSLKFPPEQYYVDQIKKISRDLKDPNISVVVVTDDKDPSSLIQRIKIAVNKSNISYHYLDNRHKNHSQKIIEDLYLMSLCDGLVRSQSHFAKTAELMGNHKFVFFAGKHKWVDNKMIITDVATKKYEKFIENNI